jgi:hypothetical protein
MPKGNVNCCKRTPGTENIITNGCGANNICIGFNQMDQCEVNDKAAYCHIDCPGGNVYCKTKQGGEDLCSKETPTVDNSGWKLLEKTLDDGTVVQRKVFATDNKGAVKYYEYDDWKKGDTHTMDLDSCQLGNYNSKHNDGVPKPMVRVFPMDWCMCRNVYWKQQQADTDTTWPDGGMCTYTSDDPNLSAVYDQQVIITDTTETASGGCNCGDNNGDEASCRACSNCFWKSNGKKCLDA